MVNRQAFIILTMMFFVSCVQRNADKLSGDTDEFEPEKLEVSREAMDEIIQNIASPIEVAILISNLDIPFSSEYLAIPENLTSVNSSYDMAFSLGALSADLGYLNIYRKTGSAVTHLTAISQLADALEVGQFFDFPTLMRLATSDGNLDSLLFISINSFNRMDEYLQETHRSDLNVLMVSGIWIEGLYLATQVAKISEDEELKTMIGEQKLILNDLLLVLENYGSETKIADLIDDFQEIKSLYDQVKITYEIGEPRAVEIDGMMMVVQSESSKVAISDETLLKIIDLTENIRNKHLNI